MAQVQPAAVEHGFVLAVHEAGVDEGAARDLEQALRVIATHQRCRRRAVDMDGGFGHAWLPLR
jgi:hypothetical protein